MGWIKRIRFFRIYSSSSIGDGILWRVLYRQGNNEVSLTCAFRVCALVLFLHKAQSCHFIVRIRGSNSSKENLAQATELS